MYRTTLHIQVQIFSNVRMLNVRITRKLNRHRQFGSSNKWQPIIHFKKKDLQSMNHKIFKEMSKDGLRK